MSNAAGGLSDVLREMASSESQPSKPSEQAPPAEPVDVTANERDEPASLEDVPADADPAPETDMIDPAEAFAAAATSGSRSSARRTPRRAPQPQGPSQVKAAAVPILLTVGALMLIPGLWAVGILVGMDVWRSEAKGAQSMAIAMLTTWPVAAGLFAGAAYFHLQVKAEKRKAGKPSAKKRSSRR